MTTTKQSAKLTKEWVMGVRRGWLKIVDPPISDWADVHQAYKNMGLFVSQLTDQAFYARRGPYTGSPTMTEGKKVLDLLGKLAAAISDLKYRATHWQNVQERKGLPGFDQADGERMLNLYRTNFLEASQFALETSPGKWRNANLTELMDKVLKLLREDAQRIKKHDEAHPEDPHEDRSVYKQFDMYGMKVVIDDSSLLPSEINEYIKYIDKSYQLLRQKGFSKAWYGTIFVQCEKCGGENQLGAELGVGGSYNFGRDVVRVFSRPTAYVVDVVVHELGHRYWFKSMSSTQRAKFEDLIEVGSDQTDKVAPVSDYGGKNVAEAWAEAFLHYVVGRDMTRDQIDSFKSVLTASANVVERFKMALKLTPESVEKWRKELRVMTKIYKSIGLDGTERDREMWAEAEKLFRNYKTNFTEWVYKTVLPLVSKQSETWVQKEIRKVTWDAQYAIDAGAFLFPTRWDGQNSQTTVYVPDFSKLRADRERNIKRYQVAFVKVFKLLDDFLKEGIERYEEVTFEVAGMNVTIPSYGRESREDSEIDGYLRKLRSFVAPVERAGFKNTVRGLKVTLNFVGEFKDGGITQASYNSPNDLMTVHSLVGQDVAGTFTHELGHRFWFKELPGQARAHWEEVMASQGAKIDQEDVEVFLKFKLKSLENVRKDARISEIEDALFSDIEKLNTDVVQKAKFRYLAKWPDRRMAEDFDLEQYEDFLKSFVGDAVLLEDISDYAASGGPVEAFAEVFRVYVTEGPGKLGPFTLDLFKRVVATSGVRLASARVVNAFLTAV